MRNCSPYFSHAADTHDLVHNINICIASVVDDLICLTEGIFTGRVISRWIVIQDGNVIGNVNLTNAFLLDFQSLLSSVAQKMRMAHIFVLD